MSTETAYPIAATSRRVVHFVWWHAPTANFAHPDRPPYDPETNTARGATRLVQTTLDGFF